MYGSIKTLFLILISIFVVQISFAQKPWEKPWQDWKKEDALKILTNSPWAHGFASIEVTYGYNAVNRSSGPVPPVILRLYSSLTVRQALLRLRQIDEKYDKMNDEQKAAFNKKNDSSLNCEQCEKYYVLILLQPTDSTSKSLVAVKFKELKYSDLKDYVFLLNDKKEKRGLAQYIAPKTDRDPAIFFFSRLDENQKPLITNESKKIVLNFKTNIRNDAIQEKFEFDIPKMIINGKVDF